MNLLVYYLESILTVLHYSLHATQRDRQGVREGKGRGGRGARESRGKWGIIEERMIVIK